MSLVPNKVTYSDALRSVAMSRLYIALQKAWTNKAWVWRVQANSIYFCGFLFTFLYFSTWFYALVGWLVYIIYVWNNRNKIHRKIFRYHCLGLGHETMVCAVCLSIFLWFNGIEWQWKTPWIATICSFLQLTYWIYHYHLRTSPR